MLLPDDIDAIRQEPDPIRQAQRAAALQAVYQQHSTELGRLRRAGMERAHVEKGMSYTDVAKALGITKGRVTQIRSSAPPAARALFGIGPVTVVLPYRYQVTDRERPLLAAEDVAAGDLAKQLLESFGFTTRTAQVGPDDTELPEGDLFVICGPKSSPAVADLLDTDPRFTIGRDEDGWFIEDRQTHEHHRSPMDTSGGSTDVAYVARRREGSRTITHVAGLHAIGSLGALTQLTDDAAELFSTTEGGDFSLLVESSHDGLTITSAVALGAPRRWDD
ncbi:hypothetical protein ATJ88_3291 [Isoptericola jiangsuensis]|uniref:Sigma-70-like protein n=1 Tax=Isoptericola jiangsuensis TaxID=548579 RepID=A0A2A9F0P3_9MICO|nr:hypothetical protein [Isoptericola jiangsuensis]PFG44563.1 hypothetical protein ATJ88_3291 [Isoptericola jiangsuensis]